ncbi:BMP-binding endothelial regulator protein-like [Saccoglossus kowalevskii]|uniref:IgGFc-binding protein-like n=1 Tax=Saccoglossus kowalevskii TaxID=10224 RepID=A0ABM0LXI1_SACKO|nr:PREDICTED: IgGFc-binding protein-like [Saccoglossus kowalevskii]
MGRVISNVVTVILFSACLTSVLAASLEGKESPVSDTGSRLGSFFHGLYQRQMTPTECNETAECKSLFNNIETKGNCLEQCDITKHLLQMNNNFNLCNKVNKCGCKCCIDADDGEKLKNDSYPCIADNDRDLCACKFGGMCKSECEDGEHNVTNKQFSLCSLNCVCCVKTKNHTKYPEGTSEGDPHLTTFDGLNYTHTGQNCTYVLFKECKPYPSFLVATKYTGFIDRRERIHSQVSDVLIKVKHTLIQLGQGAKIYVNGKPITVLPWTDGETITIRNRDSRHVNVDVKNKFTVSWTGFGNIASKLDSSLDGTVCGLLGNADGDPKNDLQMEDGTLMGIDDAEKFGDSWMIPGSCKTEVTKDEIKFIQQ